MSGGGSRMRELLQQGPREGGMFRREFAVLAALTAAVVVCCAVIAVQPTAAPRPDVELLTRSRSYSDAFLRSHVLGSRIRAPSHVSSFFGVDGQLFAERHSQYRGRTHMLAGEGHAEPADQSTETTEEHSEKASEEDPPSEEAPGTAEPEQEVPDQQEDEHEEVPTAEQGDQEDSQPEEEEPAPVQGEAEGGDEGESAEEGTGEGPPQDNSGMVVTIEPISAEEAKKYGLGEEEEEDPDKPSDFLKGIVRDVANNVMPKEANEILVSSENSVKAAQSQLLHANHLREEATAERVKARLLAKRLEKLKEYAKEAQERADWFDKHAEHAEEETKAEQDEVAKDKAVEEDIAKGSAGDEKLLQVVHRVVQRVHGGRRGRTARRG